MGERITPCFFLLCLSLKRTGYPKAEIVVTICRCATEAGGGTGPGHRGIDPGTPTQHTNDHCREPILPGARPGSHRNGKVPKFQLERRFAARKKKSKGVKWKSQQRVTKKS